MGTAGKEQRIVRLQQRRRRVASQAGKCSWRRKQGGWRWLGRSQVNKMDPLREITTAVSDCVEVSDASEVWITGMSRAACRISVTTCLILVAVIVCLAGCSRATKPSFTTFASRDEAGKGLLEAAKAGDPNAGLAIFGTG